MSGGAARSKAIVTGASSGIGAAIARRLAADGARILLIGRDEEALSTQCAKIAEQGGVAIALGIDITGHDSAARIVDLACTRLGGIDILVNCASATRNDDFFDLTDAEWTAGFETKLFAAIRLMREAWPHLSVSGGSIVNIGGIGARTPKARGVMTGALSAALMAVTKALAERGLDDGVQVNLINPGIVRTPRIETMFKTGGASDREPAHPAAGLNATARMLGARRLGEPEDIAGLVSFIVSSAGEYLQGAMIDMDGGMTRGL